ncbi:MAG: DUF72 domain-containing protein [Methanobacterium sp.]
MNKCKYYLGCSGWYYDDWKGRFYPEKLSKSKWLEYYSKYFNTVEINNTFYRFPSEKIVKGWYKRTPDYFKITLKANQIITHRKRFKDTQNIIKRFYSLSENLEDKLAYILFQLPPNISKDIDFLKKAVQQLDSTKNNVIEFRHPSWFDIEVYELLKDFNVNFCSISSSEFPEEIIVIKNTGYVRFHGKGTERYIYSYSENELKTWKEKIKNSNASKVFCYFNNDYEAHAPQNCISLMKMLNDSN